MHTADLLVSNATLHAMDAQGTVIEDGAIAVSEGRIVAIGPSDDLHARFTAEKLWNAGGNLLLPGFINTHTHLFQTFMRGLGKDLPLVEWLQQSVRRVMPRMDETAIYLAASVGCLEAIRSGTTTILDFMYANTHPRLSDPVLQAFADLGVRGILARGMCDVRKLPGGAEAITWEPVEQTLRDADRLHDLCKESSRMQIALAPGAVWNMTPEGLLSAAQYCRQHELLLTMHVLESKIDDEYSLANHARRTLPFLADLGVLNSRFLAAHCIRLERDDIDLLAQHGAKVSHNPTSNMILGAGVAPVAELQAAGVTVGLGTDGAASNDSQNLFEAMKNAALLSKVHHQDARSTTAAEAAAMATRHGAMAVGLEQEIGSLEVGKRADFIILDLMKPNTVPSFDKLATLVYSANTPNVDSVVIDGRIIMEDGHILGLDEERLLHTAAQKAMTLIQ